MARKPAGGEPEVPDGAAVFPEIPPELEIDPLLLAVLHAVVFINGSDPAVVNPLAADEALDYVCRYLQRLGGNRLRRVREDLDCLTRWAKDEKWEAGLIEVLTGFLAACGVEPDPEESEE